MRRSAKRIAARLAREIIEMLASSLDARGKGNISWVAWRVKSDTSIFNKIKRFGELPAMNDLIGIRVVLLRAGLIEAAVLAVRSWARTREMQLNEEDDRFVMAGEDNYRSVHLDYSFLRPGDIYLDAMCGVEIQVSTYLQDLHSELSHRLLYKKTNDGFPRDALAEISRQLGIVDRAIAEMLKFAEE